MRREARFEQSDPNRAYIAMWVYAEQFAAFGITLPEAYLATALKATFSQHRVSGEELQDLRGFVAQARQEFKGKRVSMQKLHAYWIRCL